MQHVYHRESFQYIVSKLLPSLEIVFLYTAIIADVTDVGYSESTPYGPLENEWDKLNAKNVKYI